MVRMFVQMFRNGYILIWNQAVLTIILFYLDMCSNDFALLFKVRSACLPLVRTGRCSDVTVQFGPSHEPADRTRRRCAPYRKYFSRQNRQQRPQTFQLFYGRH